MKKYLLVISLIITSCGTDKQTEESKLTSSSNAYQHCNAVLDGPLFNQIIHDQNEFAKEVLKRQFLSLTVDEAFKKYSENFDKFRSSGGNGKVNIFGYGSGGGEYSSQNKLSKAQYAEQLQKFKQHNSDSLETQSERSFVSNFASYIRDANSITAWEACVTRDLQPGLYAYGARGEDGAPRIHVVWAPGTFAGIAPSISISFVTSQGVSVSPDSSVIAVGSGRGFSITADDHESGFDVIVNGELVRDNDVVLGSFTSTATIPPKNLVPLKNPPAEVAPVPPKDNSERKGYFLQRVSDHCQWMLTNEKNTKKMDWWKQIRLSAINDAGNSNSLYYLQRVHDHCRGLLRSVGHEQWWSQVELAARRDTERKFGS